LARTSKFLRAVEDSPQGSEEFKRQSVRDKVAKQIGADFGTRPRRYFDMLEDALNDFRISYYCRIYARLPYEESSENEIIHQPVVRKDSDLLWLVPATDNRLFLLQSPPFWDDELEESDPNFAGSDPKFLECRSTTDTPDSFLAMAMLGENIRLLLKLSKWSRLVKYLVERFGNAAEQWQEHDEACAGANPLSESILEGIDGNFSNRCSCNIINTSYIVHRHAHKRRPWEKGM
jgi:hypothetical protein